MTHPFDYTLTALFCDDIRQEVGNKVSLMGCYQGELIVPAAPIVLPRLCVHVSLIAPKATRLKSLVFSVRVNPATELGRVQIPKATLQAHHKVASGANPGVSAALVISPFQIDKPCTLQVLAVVDDQALAGPSLQIKVA